MTPFTKIDVKNLITLSKMINNRVQEVKEYKGTVIKQVKPPSSRRVFPHSEEVAKPSDVYLHSRDRGWLLLAL